MISQARASFVRITPRKVRYVIDLIRSKNVPQAHAILNGSPRRASEIIRKLLNQAVDAAQKNSQINSADLLVSKVLADGGPSMKRFRAASMGRASVIRKRTSHILLELDLINKNQVLPAKPTTKAKTEPKKIVTKTEGQATKTAKKKSPAKKMVGAK